MLRLLHDGDFVKFVNDGEMFALPNGDFVSPAYAGWSNDDGYALETYVPPPPPEPTIEEIRAAMPTLSRAQLLLGLLDEGVTETMIFAIIDQIEDETERERARINFKDRNEFKRTHPLIEQIGSALALTPEKIDQMWQDAVLL